MSCGKPVDFLPKHLQLPQEKQWELLEKIFEDDISFILSVRLEAADEAINRQSPMIFDEEIGLDTRHPLLVPFRRTDDTAELETQLEDARAAIRELETMLKARAATAEFLRLWGAFQFACGAISSAYFARGDDLGPIRAGQLGTRKVSRAAQRKWISHLLLRQMRSGRSRQYAERDVARAIQNLLAAGSLPSGYDKSWFDMLDSEMQLKSTYRRKYLSKACMENLIINPTDDIPPTDIPIPKT